MPFLSPTQTLSSVKDLRHKTPKNIKIQNFDPPKNGLSLIVFMETSENPPPPPQGLVHSSPSLYSIT